MNEFSKSKKFLRLTRMYQLRIYPNFQKLEDLRYSASRYKLFLQHFVNLFFFKPWDKGGTSGMGKLANIAQREAKGIVKSARIKSNADCPEITFDHCPGFISKSKNSVFDYWITLTSQWKNKVKIPANSHRKLNDKLREGWELSKRCQFYKSKNGNWYLRVFVTKKVQKPEPQIIFLGVDVGLKHLVARSDGYLGKSLTPVIKLEKKKQADRQRNHHPKKPFKTKIKQLLDREVNLALRRSHKDQLNLAVEHPKTLANLKSGKLQGWARSYFANRLSQRAKEEGVYTVWINPAYTSITCSSCGLIDKRSRANQSEFECTGCGNMVNADLNAALNIARKGQERLSKITGKAPVKTFL